MMIERYEQTAHYAQVVVHGGTIYLSGQIADDWDQDISGQARQVFSKIDALLGKAGSSKSRILSLTCWISDFDDYGAFNDAYDAWVDPNNLPARATVKAELLDPTLRIEIMVTASRDDS